MAPARLLARPCAAGRLLVLGFLAAPALASLSGLELTHDNWEAETSGKKIFVDFMAPECGGCIALRPKWDQLAAVYEGSIYNGVYAVDCHGAGASICAEQKIGGFPALKYGNASAGRKALKVYSGGRTLKDLKAFAKKFLGPSCTIAEPKHCTNRDRELMKQFGEMPVAELRRELSSAQGSLKEREKQLRKRRKNFDEWQSTFEAELKEFKAEKAIHKKEGDKLLPKVGRKPPTEPMRKSHAEKSRKMRINANELDSRRKRLVAERESLDQDRWTLDADARESGLKIMQLIAESRRHATGEDEL